MELLLPKVRAPVLPRPSYEVLNMAFGVGAGAHLYDKSRYRSHGAITTATWAAGLHGYCLDFVAANPDNVTIPAAHTQLDFTTHDFSIVMRIYADSLVTNPYLFARGRTNNEGYFIYIAANGRVLVWTNQNLASQNSQAPAGTILIANWYTVGISRTGASIRIYANGIDSTTVAGVHIDPLTCARAAYIGTADGGAISPFDGRIEFLRIFRGVALQPSEHLAWHNALA